MLTLAVFLHSSQSKGTYFDLTLKSADGKAMKVHKVVICPQSSFLTKILAKTPKKHEILTPCSGPVLKAIIKYAYSGSYAIDATFKSDWKIPNGSKETDAVEFHFKVLRAGIDMGMAPLEALAGTNLNKALNANNSSGDSVTYDDKLYTKLLEAPKKSEPPFAVVEAIIEAQARKVRKLCDAGESPTVAFHMCAGPVGARFLADYIQAVGNLLDLRLRLFLRCRGCASLIRGREDGEGKTFGCGRMDCGADGVHAELVRDDRVARPVGTSSSA
jgi:hypothetical protein